MAKEDYGAPSIAFHATKQGDRDEIYEHIVMKINEIAEVMREHNSLKLSPNFHLDGKWLAGTNRWEVEIQQRYGGKRTVAAVLIEENVQNDPEHRSNIRGSIMFSLNTGHLWRVF